MQRSQASIGPAPANIRASHTHTKKKFILCSDADFYHFKLEIQRLFDFYIQLLKRPQRMKIVMVRHSYLKKPAERLLCVKHFLPSKK